jgi:hypothetical protein
VQIESPAINMNSWTFKTTLVRSHLLAASGLLGSLLGPMVCGLLTGCGTSAPPAVPEHAPPPVSAPAPRATLIEEQRRLAELFRGTPVVFAMQPDGSMRVEVPLRFSFDSASATVKPPLAAVLDRVARSQRDEASRLTLTAPFDPIAKGSTLAAERSESTKVYLVAHGISAKRLSIMPASGKNLKIVVANPPAP